jgi:hypothetical protein
LIDGKLFGIRAIFANKRRQIMKVSFLIRFLFAAWATFFSGLTTEASPPGGPTGDEEVFTAVINEVPSGDWTFGNPPKVIVEVEEVFQGKSQKGKLTVIWGPPPNCFDTPGREAEIELWKSHKLEVPKVGEKWIVITDPPFQGDLYPCAKGQVLWSDENKALKMSVAKRIEHARQATIRHNQISKQLELLEIIIRPCQPMTFSELEKVDYSQMRMKVLMLALPPLIVIPLGAFILFRKKLIAFIVSVPLGLSILWGIMVYLKAYSPNSGFEIFFCFSCLLWAIALMLGYGILFGLFTLVSRTVQRSVHKAS